MLAVLDGGYQLLGVLIFLQLLVLGNFGHVEGVVIEGGFAVIVLDDFEESQVFGKLIDAAAGTLKYRTVLGTYDFEQVVLLGDYYGVNA
jgi:hypothetical protein